MIAIVIIAGIIIGYLLICTILYFRQISEIPEFIVSRDGALGVRIHKHHYIYSEGMAIVLPEDSYYRKVKKGDFPNTILAKEFSPSKYDWYRSQD